MPRKTSTNPKTKTAEPTRSGPAGFIDAALMERAIALRGDGKTMQEIGDALGVRSTAYLAKKIRETYGPDALARRVGQAALQPKPAVPARTAARRRRAARKAV